MRINPDVKIGDKVKFKHCKGFSISPEKQYTVIRSYYVPDTGVEFDFIDDCGELASAWSKCDIWSLV